MKPGPNERAVYRIVTSAVRTAMAARGFSQRDLARALGVTEGRVSQALNNTNLTMGSLARIMDALGVDLEIGWQTRR